VAGCTEVGADTFPSVAIFHADGTYTEVLPWGQVILGAWQPTGERSVVLTQIFNYLVDDELVVGQARGTMEVDETGNTLSLETVSVGRFRDGRIDFTDEGTPTTATLETRRSTRLTQAGRQQPASDRSASGVTLETTGCLHVMG
jgi:hypothetical protein